MKRLFLILILMCSLTGTVIADTLETMNAPEPASNHQIPGVYQMYSFTDGYPTLIPDGYATINRRTTGGLDWLVNWIDKSGDFQEFNVLVTNPVSGDEKNYFGSYMRTDDAGHQYYWSKIESIGYGTYTLKGEIRYYPLYSDPNNDIEDHVYPLRIIVESCEGMYCPEYETTFGKHVWW